MLLLYFYLFNAMGKKLYSLYLPRPFRPVGGRNILMSRLID